jgi:diguanylate cyclase (GGDEF)-like protein
MDLQTLNIVSFCIALILAATMFSLHHAIPREAALRDWGIAGSLHLVPAIVGGLIMAGQDLPWVANALSNTAYVTGNAMILVGVRRHLGLRVRLDALLAFALLVFAVNWLPIARTSYTWRLTLLYPTIIAIGVLTIRDLVRHVTPPMRAAFLTLAGIQSVYVLQSLIRLPLFQMAAHDSPRVTSQFLHTSGSLATLLFLVLSNMACALIVARRQELNLNEAALRDPLTGWHNRRSLSAQAQRRFALSARDASSFGVVTIDIDHFKRINDDFGHPVGDAALQHVAALSERAFRPQDVLARIGGEEFCAVVDCDGEEDLGKMAERWRAAIEAEPMPVGSGPLYLTVSVGYSRRAPSDAAWVDVLKRADAALYAAKNGGRNRVGRPVY